MKYKSCYIFNDFHLKDAEGYFEGYASVFNHIDAHRDIVCKGSFKKSLQQWRDKKAMPKMLWQHNPSHIIGRWIDMYEDDKGLYVKGQLLLDIHIAREAYSLMKAKQIDSLSIGYMASKARSGKLNGKSVQYLDEIDVMEISLVTFASNAKAKIQSLKNTECLPYQEDKSNEIKKLCSFLNEL